MSGITYDEFTDNLGPEDLTVDKFQTLLSSEKVIEDLMENS